MVAYALFDAEKVLILDCNLGEKNKGDIKKLVIEGETIEKINLIFSKFRTTKLELLTMFLDSVSRKYGYDYTQLNFGTEDRMAIVSIELKKMAEEAYI